MGWSGVWLVRRAQGESDQAAIDRTASGRIEWNEHGMEIVANDSFEAAEPDEEFIFAVPALVRSINPRLVVIDESLECGDLHRVTLDDGDGPIVVHVYPGEVQLMPAWSWIDPPGEQGAASHALWLYMKTIGETFDCVAHDPDFDEVFDLGLGEGEAREAYNLL